MPQTQDVRQTAKFTNPLNDIAANLGVTPKVLTQLATGEDQEFRDLVRGIFSILPEDEILVVASEVGLNAEFLEYLSRLFEANTKVLLTILRNPSINYSTQQYIFKHLPQEVLTSLTKQPDTPPELTRAIADYCQVAKNTAVSHTEEFKIKMKVSRLLNDLEANMGVTIDAFLQIRSRQDQESQEFVNEVYTALPEEDALLVARDAGANPQILDYLSRLFDNNQKILMSILYNPSTTLPTRRFILKHLSEKAALIVAANPKTPPDVLKMMGEEYNSEDILATLLANPSIPEATRTAIHERVESDDVESDEVIMDAEELPFQEDLTTVAQYDADDVDAKITLCVDKLYDVNAEIVSDFIKKARTEILKRLNLIAKMNQLILKTIMRNPSLSIEELQSINMETFTKLLKKSPDEITEQTIMALLQHIGKK